MSPAAKRIRPGGSRPLPSGLGSGTRGADRRSILKWSLTVATALVLALTLAACGSDSDPTTPTDITGTYSLISVNGAPVPAFWGVFEEDEEDFEAYVMGASLELRADQTVRVRADIEFRLAGVTVEEERLDDRGTWQLVGNELTTDLESGAAITGLVDGRTLTLFVPPDGTIPASVWVFER